MNSMLRIKVNVAIHTLGYTWFSTAIQPISYIVSVCLFRLFEEIYIHCALCIHLLRYFNSRQYSIATHPQFNCNITITFTIYQTINEIEFNYSVFAFSLYISIDSPKLNVFFLFFFFSFILSN